MNLATIERMIGDGDMSLDAMRYLLGCRGECEWLDYKVTLNIEGDYEVASFARDALALKNVGGGYLVAGVEDKTWKPVGLKNALPYDAKQLRDKIRRGSGVDLEVYIVHHTVPLPSSTGLFAMVFIRSSRKRSRRRVPTVVEKDFCAGKPYGLRRGDIFVRKSDTTERVMSQRDLWDLLDTLEEQTDQDAMDAAGNTSPFAVQDGTYRLLEKGFGQFIGRSTFRQAVTDAVTRDPRMWIVNVHGPGGVGKSALVNWTTYEFYRRREFEAILQLTAKETSLAPSGIVPCIRSLYSIENLLDHIIATFEETSPMELEEKKALATELLSAWSTLLVLDNMESVRDGRILDFIQKLPVGTKAKVLLTSRQKTGGWELPVPVSELNHDEVVEFLRVRSEELGVICPSDYRIIEDIRSASGGLPLAIQWILGRYKIDGALTAALDAVGRRDSPVLEFSFGNIWTALPGDAKAVLAVMTIFDEPPTLQQLTVATQYAPERIESALAQLADVTLVTRQTQMSDGRTRYVALPITLSFAGHRLNDMGDFELACRRRYQQFSEQMRLQESEVTKFKSKFERYGLGTDNEKRATILCDRGQSEIFAGNVERADFLYKEARELAPQSAYVYAMSASYELAGNKVGEALRYADEACRRATPKTGALCYTVRARVLDVQRDRSGRVDALARALEFTPDDHVLRHQYGVALSKAGRTEDAIVQFDVIIEKERGKTPPTLTLLMALKTRMINLRRLGRLTELQTDLEFVRQTFASYPHLASSASEFDEFRDIAPTADV